MQNFDQEALLRKFDEMRQESWFPAAALMGGGLVAGVGFARRGLVGATLTALGGALAYYGMSAVCCAAPGQSLQNSQRRPEEMLHASGVQNATDEASWESFPASDPPATY